MDSAEVRERMVDALQVDLMGPLASVPGHGQFMEEVLRQAPSKWYLTGFLVPLLRGRSAATMMGG